MSNLPCRLAEGQVSHQFVPPRPLVFPEKNLWGKILFQEPEVPGCTLYYSLRTLLPTAFNAN
jgi:hypothetical protein